MKFPSRFSLSLCCCGALLSSVTMAAAQTPLVCGLVQSNSISVVGERDVYVYTAVAGEVLSLRMTPVTTSLDARLELRDSTSNLLTSASGRIDRALTDAGDYFIIALDQGDNETGGYALAVQRLADPCGATALNCPEVVTGLIQRAGEIIAYTIVVPPGGEITTLRLESLTASFTARLELFDPLGRPAGNTTSTLTAHLTDPGNYTLLISRSSGASLTGEFRLATQRIANPCAAAPAACGALTGGEIGVIGELDAFTFTAAADDVAVLKLTSLTENFGVTMEVFDPSGNALTPSFGVTRFGGTLTNAGTHTVIVRYRTGSSSTGAYSLYFQTLTAPCGSSGIIQCGGLVSGLQTPGSPVTYSFAGTAGDVLTVRLSTTTTPAQSWDIYEPDGNVVTPASPTSTWTLSKSGNYLVVLYPPTEAPQIADYAISVNTVREPCVSVPLVCGLLQAGALAEIGEIHVYTFTGMADEVVSLRVASATEFFSPVFDLYDPDGGSATGSANYSELTPTLAKTGQYTVLVHWKPDADSRFGAYRLEFQRITAPCAVEPITFGTTVTGAFDELGETVLYAFTAGPGPVTICSRGSDGAIAPYMELFTVSGELIALGAFNLQPNLASNATYRLLLKSPGLVPAGYFLRVSAGAADCPDFAKDFPSVSVLKPAEGEFVSRGVTYGVSWAVASTSALAGQEVWLSQNGGQTFTALTTNLPGDARRYDWAVPAGASVAGWRLRIVSVGVAGQIGSADTEGDFFAIDPTDERGIVHDYDELNQLISASYAPGQVQRYAYDATLNRWRLFSGADPNADTDLDGMPDAWEIARDLDPGDPRDGTADTDGDGMSNLEEYLACTDPRSPTSVFAITDAVRDGAATRVTFRSSAGRTYLVEWTTDLFSGWTSLVPVTAQFDTTTVTHTNGGSAAAHFYRVRIEPGQPCD